MCERPELSTTLGLPPNEHSLCITWQPRRTSRFFTVTRFRSSHPGGASSAICRVPLRTSAIHRSSEARSRVQGSDYFCTTRWTVVLAARGNSSEAQAALGTLCEAYYEPVVAYLLRTTRQPERARDLAHEFFVELLEGDRLGNVRQQEG